MESYRLYPFIYLFCYPYRPCPAPSIRPRWWRNCGDRRCRARRSSWRRWGWDRKPAFRAWWRDPATRSSPSARRGRGVTPPHDPWPGWERGCRCSGSRQAGRWSRSGTLSRSPRKAPACKARHPCRDGCAALAATGSSAVFPSSTSISGRRDSSAGRSRSVMRRWDFRTIPRTGRTTTR